ncbi:hypothetical protein HQ585_15410 [candidate division KSB1 bacterium]|nr:hypothetical protein [candidate division KSB1 bacterium]
MSEKFKNKYRIESARLQHWDYGWNGAYFVTICTRGREYYFGDIVNEKMQLSEIGEMVRNYWKEIPKHFSCVKLDAFIVMPNHVHGIIIINNPDDNVETLHATSLRQSTQSKKMSSISPKSGSLSVIVRSFKSTVTKHARQIHADFAWQSRFHDHIIRDDKSYNNIVEYIIYNPKKWADDDYYGL